MLIEIGRFKIEYDKPLRPAKPRLTARERAIIAFNYESKWQIKLLRRYEKLARFYYSQLARLEQACFKAKYKFKYGFEKQFGRYVVYYCASNYKPYRLLLYKYDTFEDIPYVIPRAMYAWHRSPLRVTKR